MAERTHAKSNAPTGTKADPAGSPPMVSFGGQIVLGVFLVLLGAVLVYLLVVLWPAVQVGTTSKANGALAAARPRSTTINPFGISYTPGPDVALLLLVIVVSALGSFIHATTSFIDFVGNRRLEASWIWWYLLRVFVGIALAVLFYFAVRGGFFGADTPAADINPYGIAALAGLVGLFSKQATDKLRELFDTLFNVAEGYGDDARAGSLSVDASPAGVAGDTGDAEPSDGNPDGGGQ
jgi:hypothetical protein